MPAPQTQNIYVQINPGHVIKLYADAAGTDLLNPSVGPQKSQSAAPGGKLQFSFIASNPPGAQIATADIVVVAQHVPESGGRRGVRRDSPFSPPSPPVYFIQDPAADLGDPGNDRGAVRPGPDGSIPAGKLNIRGNGKHSVPHKYSIILLCDNATAFAAVDPSIIIHPN